MISANLGSYDPHVEWVPQRLAGGVVDIHRFTDRTLPPRPKAMTPALRAGIVKMFGWQLVPGADVYVWIDASRGVARDDVAAWLLDQAGPCELLLFRHPHRRTVREEYEFVLEKLARRSPYLTRRYEHEWLKEQYLDAVAGGYDDDCLYASTAFLYRPTRRVRRLLSDWFLAKARYCLHDQLALPPLVKASGCAVRVLTDDVYDCPYLPMTRGSDRRWRKRS